MIPLWVAVALGAAFFQSIRVAGMRVLMRRQSHLTPLSPLGATLVRYAYGLPLVLFMGWVFCWRVPGYAPDLGPTYWTGIGLAGTTQIVATDLLLRLLGRRNFFVGNALTKTSTVLTALLLVPLSTLGWLVAEALSALDWAMIGLSLLAVLLITLARSAIGLRALLAAWDSHSALLGLGSGLAFAFCALGIRMASDATGLESSLQASVTTLVGMVSLQALGLGAWLAWREPAQLPALLRQGRGGWFVGVTSALGSLFWFWGFTLTHPALVQAVAQSEFFFSLLLALFLFAERPTRRELMGVGLLGLSILGLVLTRV